MSGSSVEPLLRVEGLDVGYRTGGGLLHAVRGASLTVAPGEVVAVVGESGSGKSTLAQAVIGLLAPDGTVARGSIRLATGQGQVEELAGLSEKAMRSIRGRRIGLVPQDPTVSLNPVRARSTRPCIAASSTTSRSSPVSPAPRCCSSPTTWGRPPTGRTGSS